MLQKLSKTEGRHANRRLKFINAANIMCKILQIPCNMKGFLFQMLQVPCRMRGSISTMQVDVAECWTYYLTIPRKLYCLFLYVNYVFLAFIVLPVFFLGFAKTLRVSWLHGFVGVQRNQSHKRKEITNTAYRPTPKKNNLNSCRWCVSPATPPPTTTTTAPVINNNKKNLLLQQQLELQLQKLQQLQLQQE